MSPPSLSARIVAQAATGTTLLSATLLFVSLEGIVHGLNKRSRC